MSLLLKVVPILLLTLLTITAAPGAASAQGFEEGSRWLEGTYGFYHDYDHNDRDLHVVTAGGEYYILPNLAIGGRISGYSVSGDDAMGVGLDFVARWHFLHFGRASLFLDGAVGVVEFDDRVPRGGSHFNFQEQIGPGLTFRLTDALQLIGGARFMHISNGRSDDNPGLSSIGGYIGLTHSF